MSQGGDTNEGRPHEHLTVVQRTQGWDCDELGHIWEFGDERCVHCDEHFGRYLPPNLRLSRWVPTWEIEAWAYQGLERSRLRRARVDIWRYRRQGLAFGLLCFFAATLSELFK